MRKRVLPLLLCCALLFGGMCGARMLYGLYATEGLPPQLLAYVVPAARYELTETTQAVPLAGSMQELRSFSLRCLDEQGRVLRAVDLLKGMGDAGVLPALYVDYRYDGDRYTEYAHYFREPVYAAVSVLDERGRVRSIEDDTGRIDYQYEGDTMVCVTAYDLDGVLLSRQTTETDENGAILRTVVYDSNGAVAEEILFDPAPAEETTIAADGFRTVRRLDGQGREVWREEYDPDGVLRARAQTAYRDVTRKR